MMTLFSVSADFRELLPVVESRGRFGGDQHEKQDSGAGGEQDKATASRCNLRGFLLRFLHEMLRGHRQIQSGITIRNGSFVLPKEQSISGV
ncbi:hypothetical protein G5714_002711 [Onychostoma macrolepis]|uniref:Uncharacterized protein n=1 Tax=Onychostoma macrolepis TaxID=369639 RepID=A0A7J6D7V6_9TELE|nr:hypothetical protein G5714_002711 [Onychostoma macrolepis]